ncbi:DUF4913 domain-containing protein [Nocardia sp. NPDC004415]
MTTTDNLDVANPTDPVSPAEEAVTAAVEQEITALLDLPELLDEAVKTSVMGELASVSKRIARGAVKDMLTDDVLAGMVETARHQVEVVLNPAAGGSGQPEPQEEQEEEPQTYYADVVDFVDNYLGVNYRRDVHDYDPSMRWCPEWIRHGEAKSRLSALWLAFEHLRQGEHLEQIKFWRDCVDPTMDRLLSPSGPFKHCSVFSGHSDAYKKMPTAAIGAQVVAVTRHSGHPGTWVETSSQLIVPASVIAARATRDVGDPF